MDATETAESLAAAAAVVGLDTTAGTVLMAASAVVTVANVVTMLTPSRSDNLFLDRCLKVLNRLSLNIMRNRNADAD